MAASAQTSQRVLGRDDRSHARRAVVDSGLITVELCPVGFGLLLNVSEEGIGLYTLTHVKPGDTVQVSFMPTGLTQRIDCKGELRWAADSHAGVCLRDLDNASAANLRKWIATLPASAHLEDPVANRREFPQLESQVLAIEAIAGECPKLEDALQFVNEQLLELTSGTGAAIALSHQENSGQEKMICRASAGLAPELGVPIDSSSGVTAECIRTGSVVFCEDTELDARVDRDVCRALELRSFLIVPVLHQEKVKGVLEVFSSKAANFGDDSRWLAQRLAELAAHLAFAPTENEIPSSGPYTPIQEDEVSPVAIEAPLPAAQPAAAVPSTLGESSLPPQDSPHRGRLAVSVIVPLLLAGAMFFRSSFRTQAAMPVAVSHADVQPKTSVAQPSTEPVTSPIDDAASRPAPRRNAPSKLRLPNTADDSDLIATDSIVATASPRPPAPTESVPTDPEPAPSLAVMPGPPTNGVILPITVARPELRKAANWTGGMLIRRVEPVYPRMISGQRVEGDVVLQALIGKNGRVAKLKPMKGNPALAAAAISAVREWRYEPFKRDNVPQEMTIDVTVQFRIPQ
jgi:TonB family protein